MKKALPGGRALRVRFLSTIGGIYFIPADFSMLGIASFIALSTASAASWRICKPIARSISLDPAETKDALTMLIIKGPHGSTG